MAAAGVTLIKSFGYRGAAEEWSNQYHVSAAPTDAAGWRDLVDDLAALEKGVYSTRVTIVRALCYEDTDDDSVYTYNLADFAGIVHGTLDVSSWFPVSGDDAGWVRWDTGRRSSTGKRIYLRKYFHDVYYEVVTTMDTIADGQKTAYQTFGDAMLDDFSGTIHMVGPDGSQPTGLASRSTYITTRTLKRRGRRP